MTSEGDSDSLRDLAARIYQEHAAAVDALGDEQNLEHRLGALAALLDRLSVEDDRVPDAIVKLGHDDLWMLLDEVAGEFCIPPNELGELLAAFLAQAQSR